MHLINFSAQIVFSFNSLLLLCLLVLLLRLSFTRRRVRLRMIVVVEWRKLQFSAEIFIVISISWLLPWPDVHTRALIDYKTITMMIVGNQWQWTSFFLLLFYTLGGFFLKLLFFWTRAWRLKLVVCESYLAYCGWLILCSNLFAREGKSILLLPFFSCRHNSYRSFTTNDGKRGRRRV